MVDVNYMRKPRVWEVFAYTLRPGDTVIIGGRYRTIAEASENIAGTCVTVKYDNGEWVNMGPREHVKLEVK